MVRLNQSQYSSAMTNRLCLQGSYSKITLVNWNYANELLQSKWIYLKYLMLVLSCENSLLLCFSQQKQNNDATTTTTATPSKIGQRLQTLKIAYKAWVLSQTYSFHSTKKSISAFNFLNIAWCGVVLNVRSICCWYLIFVRFTGVMVWAISIPNVRA